MAAVVLRVLAARGVEVGEDDRARIAGCTDTERLGAWSDGAATAATIGDVPEV